MSGETATHGEKSACKVLCYSPYSARVLHGLYETTIITALRLRGADVHYVMCDGQFTDCDMFWASVKPRIADACNKCQAAAADFATNMDNPFDWLGAHFTDNHKTTALAWAKGLKTEDLATASYGDWPVAQWISSSVHSHLRMGALDVENSNVRAALRSYLYSGLLACMALDSLLTAEQPDVLLLFNGRMSSLRVALMLARRRGIRVVCHERGLIDNSLLLFVNHSCLSLRPLRQLWAAWRDVALESDQLERVSTYLQERADGRNMNWMTFSSRADRRNAPATELKLSPHRRLWVLLNSSDDEVAGHADYGGPFGDQLEWTRRTVEFVAGRDDIQMVIRAHPNIAGDKASGSNLFMLTELMRLKASLPSNVHMVLPQQSTSTYDLVDMAEVGLVYHSTVGVEMACRGKEVVVAAGNWISGCELAQTVANDQEYEVLLTALTDKSTHRHPLTIARMAYRFAYALFFRWNIPFPLVKMIHRDVGLPQYRDFDELAEGKDPSLDRVCDVVLSDGPGLELPASSDDTSKSGEGNNEAEDRFWSRVADDLAKMGNSPEVAPHQRID